MPTIPQIYERYQYGAFYRNLGNWLQWCTRPWDLGEMRIFVEPNYLTRGTDICIRFKNLPDQAFRFGIQTDELLELGEYGLVERLVELFQVQFNALYISPGELIELGEN